MDGERRCALEPALSRTNGGRMRPALRQTLYEQLEALPERLTGEILNGQLHTEPRPSGRHLRVESALGSKVHRFYDEGDGGPGGWWILVEPEVHLVRDVEVAVPDIGGWRRERMSTPPDDHRFEIIPDWVCEVLSPSSASKDREIKMPLYASYGVAYLWLVDPKRRTLEAYALDDGEWQQVARAQADQVISVPPFEALRLELASLWV